MPIEFDTTFTSDNASDIQSNATYGGTEFFSSHILSTIANEYNHTTDDQWWDIDNLLSDLLTNPIKLIISIQSVVILLCVCVICLCVCYKCCNSKPKQRSSSNDLKELSSSHLVVNEQTDAHSANESEEILGTVISGEHAVGYRLIPTDIDTDVDNDYFVRESINHTTQLSIDEDMLVVHIETEPKTTIIEYKPEEKEIEINGNRSSMSSSTTITGFYPESNDVNDCITSNANIIQAHTIDIATLKSCLKAANMTRDSNQCAPFLPCVYNPQTGQLVPLQNTSINGEGTNYVSEQMHIYPTPVISSNCGSRIAINAWGNNEHCVPELPSIEMEAVHIGDEGENKTKEDEEEGPKSNLSASQVAKWVRERGKKYAGYAQGFEDHGINGRILCQYEADGDTELGKVFEKVVSDKFHRDKLISDWKALP